MQKLAYLVHRLEVALELVLAHLVHRLKVELELVHRQPYWKSLWNGL